MEQWIDGCTPSWGILNKFLYIQSSLLTMISSLEYHMVTGTAVDFHHDTTKLHLQRCGPPAATEAVES